MLVMASLIAVVGGLGLMGMMSINVLERTREIGVMRAIGASNLDIQSIVIVEGMVIGLISWVISILLSIPITVVITTGVGLESRMLMTQLISPITILLSIPITVVLTTGVGLAILTAPMPAVYGISGIFAWLIGTLLIATFASALPARRASRLTVRDTLAYE